VTRVPYKGASPALNALVANQVQLMMAAGGSALPHVRSGRLKALGVTRARPSALFPDIAPVSASGPGYESVTILAMFAPAGTPAAIIEILNRNTAHVLGGAEMRQKFLNLGIEVFASPPAVLAATMKAEIARLGKIIREAGIRAE